MLIGAPNLIRGPHTNEGDGAASAARSVGSHVWSVAVGDRRDGILGAGAGS